MYKDSERLLFVFFRQCTAYEMRISEWSSDVCSSDLARDRVAKYREHGCVLDRVHARHVLGHAVEIQRVGDIGRLRIPRIGFRLGDLDALPARVALEYVGVAGLEQIRGHGLGNDFLDLGVRWPDILEEHILAVLRLAEDRKSTRLNSSH